MELEANIFHDKLSPGEVGLCALATCDQVSSESSCSRVLFSPNQARRMAKRYRYSMYKN